jgi:hypothetical protein
LDGDGTLLACRLARLADDSRAFLGQAPLTLAGMLLIAWKLEVKPRAEVTKSNESATIGSKLKRIDFVGAFFLSTTILSAMLVLDMGGEKVPWSSPLIFILVGSSITAAAFFYFIEKYWANEPIFPLRLLSHRPVVLDYGLQMVQVASQMAVRGLFTFSTA